MCIILLCLISHKNDKSIKEARDILLKIEERNLYKFVAQTNILSADYYFEKNLSKDKFKKMRQELVVEYNKKIEIEDRKLVLKDDDILIIERAFDFGARNNNPVEKVYFYNKHDVTRAFRIKTEQVCSLTINFFI
jgi:hypothetical protein